jgi:ribokinase
MPDQPDRARICVVGSINMDLVIRAPRLPAPGETLLGGPFSTSPGGKGANQAVAAARMAAQVSFIGAVGEDEHGRSLLATLTAETIDTTRIQTRPGAATGTALITVGADAQNTIVVAPGANATLTPLDIDAARSTLSEADIILLQLECPLPTIARAAELARELGTTVLLNAAPAPDKLPMSILCNCDVLIVNETEAAAVAGLPAQTDSATILSRLASLGPRTVILTLGPEGALFTHAREPSVSIPACPVEPIDTVGAGDAFCGTLAVRLAELQIASRGPLDRLAILDAVCWACAAGALATTKSGAIPSLPCRSEVVKMLREIDREPAP